MMAIFLKDPAARVDYAIDWSAGYLNGQTIAGSTWDIAPATPDGINISISRFEPGRSIALLEGGQRGEVYRITNRVILSDGRSDERTLLVRVEDR